MYFCTIGFAASFKMLKTGGAKVVKFLIIAAVFAFLQDVLAVGLSGVVGFPPCWPCSPPLPPSRRHGHLCRSSTQRGSPGLLRRHYGGRHRRYLRHPLRLHHGGPVATRLIEKHDLFTKFQARDTSKDTM